MYPFTPQFYFIEVGYKGVYITPTCHRDVKPFQGVSGNSIYSVPNAELLLSLDVSVNEFPRENLRFVEVLGEGQFGEVHLCEASNMGRYAEEDYMMNRTMSRPVLVAVKILRIHADDRARYEIYKIIVKNI